jgi:hypothetical protein
MLEVIKPIFDNCTDDICGKKLSQYVVKTKPHLFYLGKAYTREYYHYFTVKYGQQGIFTYENGSLISDGLSGNYDTTNLGVSMFRNRRYIVEFEAEINSGSMTVNSQSISDGFNSIEITNTNNLLFISTSFDGVLHRIKIQEVNVFELYGNGIEDVECEFYYQGWDGTGSPPSNYVKYEIINGGIYANWWGTVNFNPTPRNILNQFYFKSMNGIKEKIFSFSEFVGTMGNGLLFGSTITTTTAAGEWTYTAPTSGWYLATFRVEGTFEITDDSGTITDNLLDGIYQIWFKDFITFKSNQDKIIDFQVYKTNIRYTRPFVYEFETNCDNPMVEVLVSDCVRDIPLIIESQLKLVSLNDERFELLMNNAGLANQLDRGTFELYEWKSSELLPSDVLETVLLLSKNKLIINGEEYLLYTNVSQIDNETDNEGGFELLLLKNSGYLNKNCDICTNL